MFTKSFKATLGASAIKVDLPEGFFQNTIANRRAIFFSEVIKKYLPVQILKGELIVGGQFNTALSKTLNPEETKRWKKREKKMVPHKREDEHLWHRELRRDTRPSHP